MIDTRLLLSAHPLWQRFDPSSRRFLGTFSDPTLVKKIGMEGMDMKILETEETLARLPGTWKKRMDSASKEGREAVEKAFLKEKKNLEIELTLLRGQRFFVKDIPGRPIFSEVASILPQVTQMASDVIKIVGELKQAHQARTVIDISSFLPHPFPAWDSKTLMELKNMKINRALMKSPRKELFFRGLIEAKKYWLSRDDNLNPIPVGAEDCRLESLEKMKQLVEAEKSE